MHADGANANLTIRGSVFINNTCSQPTEDVDERRVGPGPPALLSPPCACQTSYRSPRRNLTCLDNRISIVALLHESSAPCAPPQDTSPIGLTSVPSLALGSPSELRSIPAKRYDCFVPSLLTSLATLRPAVAPSTCPQGCRCLRTARSSSTTGKAPLPSLSAPSTCPL